MCNHDPLVVAVQEEGAAAGCLNSSAGMLCDVPRMAAETRLTEPLQVQVPFSGTLVSAWRAASYGAALEVMWF